MAIRILLLAVAGFLGGRAEAQAFMAAPPAAGERFRVVLPTTLDQNGNCVVAASAVSGTDAEKLRAADRACRDALQPRRPTPAIGTPGAFFVGYAWGAKSKQFVYGPQVGVSGMIEFPLSRPGLEFVGKDDRGNLQFRRPRSMRSTVDLAASINVNFAAFTFPNSNLPAGSSTQQTFNAGLYVAPEFGWAWWDDDGSARRVRFAIGVMAGVINTDATGNAFVLGLQPALIAQF